MFFVGSMYLYVDVCCMYVTYITLLKLEPVIIHAISLHGFMGGPREKKSNSWDQIALGTNLMTEKTRA